MGKYPEVSLRKARDGRDEARRQLRAGIDPLVKRQSDVAAQEDTFQAIARELFVLLRKASGGTDKESFVPTPVGGHSRKRGARRELLPEAGRTGGCRPSCARKIRMLGSQGRKTRRGRRYGRTRPRTWWLGRLTGRWI